MKQHWSPDLAPPAVRGLEDGADATAFNVCSALCDQHIGRGQVALRWLSADGQTQYLTFEELRDRACRFANVLRQLGVEAGDRVSALLPRTPDLLTVLLGTLRAGAVYQPLFTAFGPQAIASRVAVSMPKLVVTDRANRPKLDGLNYPVLTSGGQGDEDLSAALRGASALCDAVPMSGRAPFLMMFTSGTTGSPKGVLVPSHMLRAVGSYMRYGLDLRETDVFWNMADPGWAYGLYYGVIGPLLLGGGCTLSEAPFSVERSYELMRQLGVSNLTGAPTAYRQMAASPEDPPHGLRVISSAGEQLDTDTAAWLTRAFGCPVRDHFGQTELGMVLCDHHGLDHPRHPGSIGYPLPGFRVTITSPTGAERPRGTPGLLTVDRNSPLFWFAGYHQPDGETKADGGHVTGDTAMQAPDGSFRFVGRDDDVITSSGYRIGPSEVENMILTHPAVLEAAVIGRPDPVRTESVKAYLVLKPGFSASPALEHDISSFVKRQLSAHLFPREFAFVDSLPRTVSGKLQRKVLRVREVRHLID